MTSFNSTLYLLLGERIRKFRHSLGLSQEDVAQQIGLNRASISNIEVGRHQIPLTTLFEISKILSTEIHYLLPTSGEVAERMNKENNQYLDAFKDIQLPDSTRENIMNMLNNL